jgi:hypothetical protein
MADSREVIVWLINNDLMWSITVKQVVQMDGRLTAVERTQQEMLVSYEP